MKIMTSFAVMHLLCSCATHDIPQFDKTDTTVTVNMPDIERSKPDIEIPKKIEWFLMEKLGLSSTGSIKAIGKYCLTHDSNLGKETDTIIHIVQKDLFGSRLFWSCLVNEREGKIQVLYRCQNPDEFGTIMLIEE